LYFLLETFDYDVSRKDDIPYIHYRGQPQTLEEMKKKSDIDTYNLALLNEMNDKYKKNFVGKTPIYFEDSSSVPKKFDKSKQKMLQKNDSTSTKTNNVKKSGKNSAKSLSSKSFSKSDTGYDVDMKSNNLFKQTSSKKKDADNVIDTDNCSNSNTKNSNESENLSSEELNKKNGKKLNSRFELIVSEESVEDSNDKENQKPKKVLSDSTGKKLYYKSENDDSNEGSNYLPNPAAKITDELKSNTVDTLKNNYKKKETRKNQNEKLVHSKLEHEPKKDLYEDSRDDSNGDLTLYSNEESKNLRHKYFKHDKEKKKPYNKFKEGLVDDPVKKKTNHVLDTKNNITSVQISGERVKPLSSHQMVDEENSYSNRLIKQHHHKKSGRKDGKINKTILRVILENDDNSSDESDQDSTEIKSKQLLRKRSNKNLNKTTGKVPKNHVKSKSHSATQVDDKKKDLMLERNESTKKSPNKTIEDSSQSYESENRAKKRSRVQKKRTTQNQNKRKNSKGRSHNVLKNEPKKLTIVKYKVYGR